jgi:predicted nucleic acid-binding protein
MAPNRILPDTCAWIDFFRGKESSLTVAVEKSLLQAETVTCGVVIMELLQGVKSSREEKLVLNAFQALTHLEMNRDLWASAGRLAAVLRAKGHNIPFSDIIIATLTTHHHCTLLTVDRHFEDIPGLSISRGDV